MKLSRYLLLGSITAAVCVAQSTVVTGLECARMQCASRAAVIQVKGSAEAAANASLTLLVVDEGKQIVRRESLNAGADGSFAASVDASALRPGRYQFGFVTSGRSSVTIAAGSFSVSRTAARREGDIEVFQAETIKPYEAQSISPQPATPAPRPAERAQNSRVEPAARGDMSDFFHLFGLAVPGVAYTVDNYAANTRTLVTSTGVVTRSSILVNPDGTYIWNSSWDDKLINGRWTVKDAGILILKGQEGKDWFMQRRREGGITLSDGSTWYNGTLLPDR